MADTYAGNRIILTYEDYCALPDDGRRYEILAGELIVSPSPKTRHQEIVGNLYNLLRGHVTTAKRGRVFFAPYDVVLDDNTVVQPDLIYVSNDKRSIVGEDNVRGAPDLLIEVLSPSNPNLDLRDKRQLYARYGVPWYWIVDGEARALIELECVGDAYAEVSRPTADAKFSPKMFDGFEIPLAEVWA